MNKVVRIVILSVLAFSFFVACKNYTADIDDYLSYWSTESSIADYTFDPLPQIDAEKAHCVPSKMAVTVTFTVRNPRNFDFKMPGAVGAPADIVTFPYIGNEPDQNAAIALQPGIDYEFTKISNTKLALTYTPVFLQKHEWGRGDITPTIILYTTDGRHFKQDIQFALKVNTPPPAITHYVVAETKTNDSGKDAYYVLCLQIPNMDVSVPGGLLHKDIVGIEINGITYPLSVNEEQHTFIKPEDTAFLDITDVEKLEADEADIPSGWVLYFKTDVPVKEGSAKKGYTIKLIDVKGLTSPELKASTKPNKLQKEVVTVAKGETTGTGNGTASSPIIIGTGAEGAAVMISSPTPNTTVHCMLTEVGQAPAPEQTGSPSVTVALPLNGANEKRYKLEYYTDGEGFAATARQTSYYKIVLKHTVTFNLAGGNIDGNTNAITMTGIPGTSFTKPVDPVKEGYTFNGWNPALPAPLVFPAADTEYTAQWTANQYTVHFDGNENTGGFMSDQTFTYGTSQALQSNSFTKDGYTFKGWAYSSDAASPSYNDGQSVENLTVTNNVVVQLYAVWQINTYTVEFKVAGGQGGTLTGTYNSTPKTTSDSTEQQFKSVPYNSTITFTATPDSGYAVDGWTGGATPEAANNKKASLTVQDNVTVTVTFKAVGGQSQAVSTWEALRKAVQYASDDAVIEIAQNLTYDISAAAGKESIIKVTKDITIKSTASPTYTLDAGGRGADNTTSNVKSTGIFEVDDGKTLTLENVILTKTEKYAVYVDHNSSLTMKNVTITNCKTQYNAAGIYFNQGKDLTLENCIIEKCKGKGSGSSGGINIQEPKGTVSIKDTTIENCEAKANGGGMYLNNVANCTLEKVKIQKCSAANGGGIYNSGGTLILKECSIGDNASDSGNTAKKGGGVYLKNVVTLTMQNVTVKNNKALTQGGGIYLADGELKIPADTTIAHNSATNNTASNHNSEAGGGIYVEKGTLTLNGGIIFGNSANANKGGGVYLNKTSSFIMNSGEIKNCSAKYGGGVSLAGTSTFRMNGGTITGCKAEAEGEGEGGGIYTEVKTQLTLEQGFSMKAKYSKVMLWWKGYYLNK